MVASSGVHVNYHAFDSPKDWTLSPAVVSQRGADTLTLFVVSDRHFVSVVLADRAVVVSVEAGAEDTVAQRGGGSIVVRVVTGNFLYLVDAYYVCVARASSQSS